jgi:peptidoglycan/xylan/chitin deacetylase (PgdA/CDA1 family)
MRIAWAISSTAAFAAAVGLAGTIFAATPSLAQNCPGNPDAIGTSRVIAIDPADYPRIGSLQYPLSLPLQDHEVVLSFDDGPLPPSSTRVLDVLASQCVKANFFLVGEMAHSFPAVVRRIYQDGHVIGTHSEDHPLRFGQLPIDKMRWEIDQGIANVAAALGDPSEMAPFFRIPGFARSDSVEEELAARHLAVFSTDTVEDDWHRHITAKQIIALALSRLEKRGRGILLLHDIHPWTADALPGLLKELKDHGFHIVQVVPAGPGVPETVVAAAATEMRVAWTPAQQDIMDDSGEAPIWPTLNAGLQAERVALAAPDADALEANYPLLPAAGSGKIVTAAATGGEDAPLHMALWPDQQDEAALQDADPQLPAPSVADIGWPVQERRPAVIETKLELRPSVDVTGSIAIARGRHRHAHLDKPSDAKAGPPTNARRHARVPAGTEKHAGLAARVAALFTPAH